MADKRICYFCSKAIASRQKFETCDHCLQDLHITCSKIFTVRDLEDQLLKVCASCHHKLTSDKGVRSRSHSTGSNTRPETPSEHHTDDTGSTSGVPSFGDNALLKQILRQMVKSDQFESLSTKLGSFQSTIEGTIATLKDDISGVKADILDLNKRMDPLAAFPNVVDRLTAAEGKIEELTKDNHALQELVNAKLTAAPTATPDPAAVEKLNLLQETNIALTAKVSKLDQKLSNQQLKLSPEIVISGVEHGDADEVDYATIALAVMKTLRPSTTEHDILSARLMRRKKPTDATPPNPPSQDTTGTRSKVATGPSPICVNLMSASLARVIIDAKIRLGKLHLTKLQEELLTKAGCTVPLKESLISINEYLPHEIHRLKMKVRDEARAVNNSFSHFVRNGEIFARWNKKDSPVLISSEDDLEHFLSTKR